MLQSRHRLTVVLIVIIKVWQLFCFRWLKSKGCFDGVLECVPFILISLTVVLILFNQAQPVVLILLVIFNRLLDIVFKYLPVVLKVLLQVCRLPDPGTTNNRSSPTNQKVKERHSKVRHWFIENKNRKDLTMREYVDAMTWPK